jgi:glyoxylase-like metal-dependent hydrolase (beta-lactamase superfamily II)
MRSFILAAALLLCGCASGRPLDPYAYVSEDIAPRVWVLRQAEFHVQPRGNVTIVEQRRGVVLIDSGGSPSGAEQVIEEVRARTRKPVTAIVLTHWHGDHVLGAARLLEEWPRARLIATTATGASLSSPSLARFMPGDDAAANAALQENIAGGVAYLNAQANDETLALDERLSFAQAANELQLYGLDMQRARRLAPNEVFDETLTLNDAYAPVEVRFVGRANTDGDAVAWLPRQRILITGDVAVAPVPYGFGSYPQSWIGVLRHLKTYDAAAIVPGHGAPMYDDAYFDQLIALLEEVRAQAGPLAGLSDEEARARFDLSAQRAAFTGGDPWLERWFDAYFTQPILVSALKEARGQPIVQGE